MGGLKLLYLPSEHLLPLKNIKKGKKTLSLLNVSPISAFEQLLERAVMEMRR